MDITKLSPGKNPPEIINVVIEIPQGSHIKYEMDKDSGFIVVDRFAFTTMGYPFNYGFIPNTMAEDGDPVDVLVISTYPVDPGCVIAVRPIGMLEMEDEEGIDTKILAVPIEKVDPFLAHIKDIGDVPEADKNKVRHFFEHYKDLEKGKWVKLKEFLGKDKAIADIRKGMK
ncbi:MAG: inorganic diphosphatase [Candidatus Roizmanbacteria bacterium]